MRPRMRRKALVLVLLWLALLALCMAFVDQPVKQWLYDHRFHDPASHLMKGTLWASAMRAMGYYPTTIAVVLALVLVAKFPWRSAAVTLICAAASIANDALKWLTGRSRPILKDGSLSGPWDFLPFHAREAGNAFPSGHTMLAFATAACLARYYPRWAWLWYLLASVVAAERVLEVAHHVSDVVGAAGLAIVLSAMLTPILERTFRSPSATATTTATATDPATEAGNK